MERTCRQCGYNTLSQVVQACPNCGAPLPGLLVRGGGGLGRALATFVGFAILGSLAYFAIRLLVSPDFQTRILGAPVTTLPMPPPPTPPATRPAAVDVDALVRELTARDPARRRAAAVKLGTSGDRRAVSPLLSAARDLSPAVRAVALEALARVTARGMLRGDERMRVDAVLVRAATDPDAGVRAAATRAATALATSR